LPGAEPGLPVRCARRIDGFPGSSRQFFVLWFSGSKTVRPLPLQSNVSVVTPIGMNDIVFF